MALLAAENITKKFGDRTLLSEVSFTIQPGDRIALVGSNGIGKTTLLDLLAGRQSADTGSITGMRNLRIDYAEQEKESYLDLTLFDYVAGARDDLLTLKREIESLQQALSGEPGNEDFLTRLGESQHRFEQAGGFDLETHVETVLTGLGFPVDRQFDRIAQFSGGEKNRAGLARVLCGNGDLLLLDEPTNHLDIESTIWLEEYLASLPTAQILVSHDRAFLSAVVNGVWELSWGTIDTYPGAFSHYLTERSERRRLQEHRYRHQQQEIARVKDYIARNMAGQKTKQAQSKLKYLNKMKRLSPPKGEASGPSVRVNSSGRSWHHVIAIEDLALGYGRSVIVDRVSLDLFRGDKLGIVGRNGAGKSTLVKALLGELEPLGGEIRLGANVDVSYFDQELSDLDTTVNVLDNIWQVDPAADAGTLRSYLARFGFSGEDVMTPVRALSGGEKTKLCLARLLYYPANLLIFDEPTNHLDIQAREALERALLDYDGTLIVVSHDRAFLSAVVDKVLHIENGTAHLYPERFDVWLAEQSVRRQATRVRPTTERLSSAQLDRARQKERERERSKRKKALAKAETTVAELETELQTLERDLHGGIDRNDWEALMAAGERKQVVEEELLRLYDQVESLRAEVLSDDDT